MPSSSSLSVLVSASGPPLVGSSGPAALERFCGERLVDRALALVAEAFGASSSHVAVGAAQPFDLPAGVALQLTTASTLRALLAEVDPAGATVALAIDARHPMLTASTLRQLVEAASAGRVAVVGGSVEQPAAVARPLPASDSSSVTVVPALGGELALVDSKRALVELERHVRLERAHALLDAGLLVRDSATTRIDGPITFGSDVEIEPGCTLRGPIMLGDGVRIGAHSVIVRSTLGAHTEVRPFTIIEDAVIGEHTFVGPYARVRPGSDVGHHGQIGNFVELKAARLGAYNRINHLSFVGDATFEERVTIGAGTITCNHDGVRSQPTTIGAGAYVGSGCILVAPIAVGQGATVGAGSTLTTDAPPSKLTLARTRQVVVDSWRGFESKTK